MSIGTLLAYTIVSASVIILRYSPETSERLRILKEGDDVSIATGSTHSDNLFVSQAGKLKPEYWWLSSIVTGCGHGGGAATGSLFIFICCSTAFCIHIHFSGSEIVAGEWWAVTFLVFITASMIGCLVVISAHQQNASIGTFRVPWVPVIPGISILSNVGLMVHLNVLTWLRFVIWMTLGLLVYFLYGIRHSKESDLANSSSMLMTSSEANKEPWGAINPRDDSSCSKTSPSHEVCRRQHRSERETDDEKKILVDDPDWDSQ